MSDSCGCCSVNGNAAEGATCEVPDARVPQGNTCPQCGQRGKAVDSVTLKALLSVSLEAVRGDAEYFFCREADCNVVYFSAEGDTFTTEQVRERVYQKEPDADDVFVCYCFRHTPGSIRAELAATGHSTVVESINAGIKAGQCACDLRNPQGTCCLGNVQGVVKQVTGAPQTA